MPAPTIKIDDAKMLRKMRQYEQVVGKEVRQLVQNAGRLCCVQLAKFTQPYGTNLDAKRTGEKAITKDVQGGKRSTGKGKGRRGLFVPLTPFMQANAEFYGSSENIRLFVKKTGRFTEQIKRISCKTRQLTHSNPFTKPNLLKVA